MSPYYAPAWAYGGVVQAVTGLAEAQATLGHQVTVLTTDSLDRFARVPVHEEMIGGVRVIRRPNLIPGLRRWWNLSSPVRFGAAANRLLSNHSVDLIHVHELRTVENALVAPYAVRAGVPMVVSPHGTLPYRAGKRLAKVVWDLALGRRWLRTFDQVISLTAREAEEARWLWRHLGLVLPDDHIATVPNGVNVSLPLPPLARESFREQWGLGKGPVMLFLGRLAPRKGLRLLVSSFAAVAVEFPDARLLLVGPDEGSVNPLTTAVRRHHLESRVTFTGLLIGEEKSKALAASDFLVLPSAGEGLSMAVLEALSSGLPVVLTESQTLPKVIAASAALLAQPHVDSLAEALRCLLASPDRRRRMGVVGKEIVTARYLWPFIAQQVDEVYETVMDRKRKALP